MAPIGFGAVRLRARLLPGWSGAPARLVEAVIGLALVTVVLQVLAAVGLFQPLILVAASVLTGLGVAALTGRLEAGEGEPPPAPDQGRWLTILALVGAAFLATHWATGLQDVWGRGMLTFDTLWYHGPFATRLAQEGSVWGLHFTDPLYLNWFYPQNSELLHAVGVSLLDRDLLSPFVNFGWLGLALLAAWCIGRPYGVAPLSLVAVAIVLDTGPMVPREAGTGANDIAPIALILAAAAVLISSAAREGGPRLPSFASPSLAAIAIAGLAAGLALGTKLTIGGAVLALAVGVPLLVPREQRWRALGIFLGAVAAVAGFWFLRNLVHTGNPLPWVTEIGPLSLPGPERGLEGRDPFSVAHYVFPPDFSVWDSYFFESIRNLLGPAWPLIMGGSVAGGLLALLRPRSPAVRLCGAVTILAGIAYVFTPLTAAGSEGEPLAFSINFRYLVAALALGVALLTLEPKLTPQRARLPLLCGGLLALVAVALYSDSATSWDESTVFVPTAILIGTALVAVPVGLTLLARARPRLAVAAAVLVAALTAGVVWERADSYFAHRYAGEGFRFQLDDAIRWAKHTKDLRIGVAGTSGGYYQYGFYGDELSNHVQFLGDEGPAGDFRRLRKCAPFRKAVNDGDYDYVITTPNLDLNNPGEPFPEPERGWVASDPKSHLVLRNGHVAIYRIPSQLAPGYCTRR